MQAGAHIFFYMYTQLLAPSMGSISRKVGPRPISILLGEDSYNLHRVLSHMEDYHWSRKEIDRMNRGLLELP